MIKKLISASLGLGLFLSTAAPTLAGYNGFGGSYGGYGKGGCTNAITGPYSKNKCEISNESKQKVDVDQYAYVKNKNYINANTGTGDTKYNTVVKGFGGESGDVDVTVNNTTKANAANVNVQQSGKNATKGSNILTGPFSYNSVDIDNEKKQYVNVSQNANVQNYNHINANTGSGDTSYNTLVKGGGESGDVNVNVNNTTEVNWLDLTVKQ